MHDDASIKYESVHLSFMVLDTSSYKVWLEFIEPVWMIGIVISSDLPSLKLSVRTCVEGPAYLRCVETVSFIVSGRVCVKATDHQN